MKSSLSRTTVEKEVVAILTDYCQNLGISVSTPIDGDFVPGSVIKSHVLLTAISVIAAGLGVVIPSSCYIFFNADEHRQLSINETVEKILKVAINEK